MIKTFLLALLLSFISLDKVYTYSEELDSYNNNENLIKYDCEKRYNAILEINNEKSFLFKKTFSEKEKNIILPFNTHKIPPYKELNACLFLFNSITNWYGISELGPLYIVDNTVPYEEIRFQKLATNATKVYTFETYKEIILIVSFLYKEKNDTVDKTPARKYIFLNEYNNINFNFKTTIMNRPEQQVRLFY